MFADSMFQQIPNDPCVALMPTIGRAASGPERTLAHGEQHGMVGVLPGCVQRELLLEVNAATPRVLAVKGFNIVTGVGKPQPLGEATSTTPFLPKTR